MTPQEYIRIKDLLRKHLHEELTNEEQTELRTWAGESASRKKLIQHFTEGDDLKRNIQYFFKSRENISARLKQAIPELHNEPHVAKTFDRVQFLPPSLKLRRVIKTAWVKYAAAVIIILGTGAYLWNTTQKESPDEMTASAKASAKADVPAPSSTRAVLTLSNGQQIFVDSAAKGTLAIQGGVNIQKKGDGLIEYKGSNKNGAIQYNTLTVPRGSEIASIVLSDGSKVVLNSASSLKYPVAFVGNERRVEVTGEAYFEVAKDPKKKFVVLSNGLTTEVLGTHFNVNTYGDEHSKKGNVAGGKSEG